jgi:hypothetical protein
VGSELLRQEWRYDPDLLITRTTILKGEPFLLLLRQNQFRNVRDFGALTGAELKGEGLVSPVAWSSGAPPELSLGVICEPQFADGGPSEAPPSPGAFDV